MSCLKQTQRWRGLGPKPSLTTCINCYHFDVFILTYKLQCLCNLHRLLYELFLVSGRDLAC